MATDKEIQDAYLRQDDLNDSKRELERVIRNAKKKLEKVQAELDLANAVDEIFNGVTIHISCDTPTAFDMKTLARGPGIMPRDVHAYQIATGTTWAVRVNGGDTERPLFSGGQVIGLGRGWARTDAMEIAKRWLAGDESVLVA